ncbi:MAG TPA: TetR family transcriptional regulator [Rhizomicrobium sp.]|jgi:AcrR family transcriptional regulator
MGAGASLQRFERRSRQREASRKAILDAARRVAAREGARNLSLRSVAAEAGFAPAALYVYFCDKDELMLALAADDLAALAHAMRDASRRDATGKGFSAAAATAVELLANTETLAAAWGAVAPEANGSDAGRLFNGRLIAALTALSAAAGETARTRESQGDVVLLAAALAGLALFVRGGRLEALGFSEEELLARLESRIVPAT